MGQKVFIPITDELLYQHPELITSPLCPYQIDRPCFHWMATIESADKADSTLSEVQRFDHTMNIHRNIHADAQRPDAQRRHQPQHRSERKSVRMVA